MSQIQLAQLEHVVTAKSLKTAQTTLKTKAMRAFFGLKGTVNKSKISFRAQTTLFDSLIKPIALYGAPIWYYGYQLLPS